MIIIIIKTVPHYCQQLCIAVNYGIYGVFPLQCFPHTPIFLPASGSHLPSHYSGGKPSFPITTRCIPIYFHRTWIGRIHTHSHYSMVYVLSPIHPIQVCWSDYNLNVCVMPCIFASGRWLDGRAVAQRRQLKKQTPQLLLQHW